MSPILVTGADGNVGRELVRCLAARGVPFRSGHHSKRKADDSRAAGREAVVLDYGLPETCGAALSGIGRLFLVSPSSPAQPEQEGRMVEEALRAGVRHIVKLSIWRAPEEATSFARWNRQAEREVEASGISYTFLRPNSFMQSLISTSAESIRSRSLFRLPAGNARISHIDVRDIAAAAAVALTEEGHAGRAYDLSGPETLTYFQIADFLSQVLGRRIAYESVPDLAFARSLTGLGVPEWRIRAVLEQMRDAAQGQASDVLGSIQQIVGRKPISFHRFARDHREAFS
jgi:uncharacterized protein YbjT (DUF2867 family)